jgi:hypothetical protein
MAEPAVVLADDGRVVVVFGSVADAQATAAGVCRGEEPTRRTGGTYTEAVRGFMNALLSGRGGRSDSDTPVVEGVAVDELLAAAALPSMSTQEAAVALCTGDRQVRRMRARGVLRPAGRGRVLAVDVEALRAARTRGV